MTAKGRITKPIKPNKIFSWGLKNGWDLKKNLEEGHKEKMNRDYTVDCGAPVFFILFLYISRVRRTGR